jgi:hypothetical protein
MNPILKQSLWKQFGAAIDMLANAVNACPDALWDADSKFWHNAYHCAFYLDYYLTLNPDNFHPPAPFGLSEFDPSGIMPERTYTKEELLNYISFCKNKCYQFIASLTDELAKTRWVNPYRNYDLIEILLYNMRHVQHHAGQLNLLIRQHTQQDAPRWVSQTKEDL